MPDITSIVPNQPQNAVEVYYGGVRMLPAPLIDWSVESIQLDNGQRVGIRNSLTLTSSIVILPSGSYEQLYIKQQGLRDAFGIDHLDFVIVAGNGNKTLPQGTIISSGLKPNVKSVNISSDIHVTKFDYTIQLEAISSGITGLPTSGIVSSLSNQWSFKEDGDSCVLNVTHNVSAQGIQGQTDAFLNAMAAVKPLLGINKLPIDLPYFTEPNASGSFNITHPSNPNGGPIFEISVQRDETADVIAGSYSVTEIFTIVSGVPFFYSSKQTQFTEDENGIASVTIQGTVQGLGRTNTPGLGLDGGIGFQRAVSGFINHIKPNIPAEASGVYITYKLIIGSGLNVIQPTNYSITENKCRGTIAFSVSYTDNLAQNLPSGIVSRIASTQIQEGIRLIASHIIPFRRLGNLLQDIRTTTEGTISLQCQAQAKNTGNRVLDINRAIQSVQDELNRLRVIHAKSANYITLRISGVEQQIDDIDLTCNSTVSYIFTTTVDSVLSPDSDINLRMIN